MKRISSRCKLFHRPPLFEIDAISPRRHMYVAHHVNPGTPSTTSIDLGSNLTYVKAILAFATRYGQPETLSKATDATENRPLMETNQDCSSGAIGRETTISSSPSNYLDTNRDVMTTYTSSSPSNYLDMNRDVMVSATSRAASSSSSQVPDTDLMVNLSSFVIKFAEVEHRRYGKLQEENIFTLLQQEKKKNKYTSDT